MEIIGLFPKKKVMEGANFFPKQEGDLNSLNP
jgi:hypothetical protein